MKKILLILSIFLIAGCSTTSSSLLYRSQIHTGMTRMDVWKLYGFDVSDFNSWNIPQFTNQSIAESQNGDCTRTTYRYWLSDYDQEHPFLLTFESCKLPNYDEVQKEKKRRIDNYKQHLKNDPNLQKELDAFCEANQADPESVIEFLALDLINHPFTRYMTDAMLIRIQRDEDYKNAKKRNVSN